MKKKLAAIKDDAHQSKPSTLNNKSSIYNFFFYKKKIKGSNVGLTNCMGYLSIQLTAFPFYIGCANKQAQTVT